MNSPLHPLFAMALDTLKTQQQFAELESSADNRPNWQIELDEHEAAEAVRAQQRKDEYYDRQAREAIHA